MDESDKFLLEPSLNFRTWFARFKPVTFMELNHKLLGTDGVERSCNTDLFVKAGESFCICFEIAEFRLLCYVNGIERIVSSRLI